MKNSSSERNTKMRNNDSDDDKPLPNRPRQEKAEDMKLWGILIFGLIGATATTFAAAAFRGEQMVCIIAASWKRGRPLRHPLPVNYAMGTL
ncbi:hypothetical protein RHMOL_Rhmol07G0279600 [Rhododendron molle]|uniref:Uncharacterized protein n=1 Tax=Rhododendron molle TaxID=49168 RepID=A0ACC0N5J8_RHOML|nr:hypothetical protein RHMOL_Rhmol07G0279600 [Rhododendron molle]